MHDPPLMCSFILLFYHQTFVKHLLWEQPMAGSINAELHGTHSLAYQGSCSDGGMIPLQNHQHDSRKAEAPQSGAAEVRETSTSWR